MDTYRFWEIVDETRALAHGNLHEHVETLHARLSQLAVEEVVEFDRLLVEANHELYSWTLWGATDLIFGSGGDDQFTDVRTWIVSLGSETYDAVRRDAQSLAELDTDPDVEDLTAAEQWAAVPARVFAGATGRDLSEAYPERVAVELPEGEPEGNQLSDVPEDLVEIFPRLGRRFG